MRLFKFFVVLLTISFNLSLTTCDLSTTIKQVLQTLNDDNLIELHSLRQLSINDDKDADVSKIDNQALAELLTNLLDNVINDTLASVDHVNGIKDEKMQQDTPSPTSSIPLRKRRSEFEASKNPKDAGVQRLTGITPLFATCDKPLQITTVEFSGAFIGVCISAKSRNEFYVHVGQLSLSGKFWESRVRLGPLAAPRMSAVFADHEALRVMTVDASKSEGVLMQTYDKNLQQTHDDQVIPAHYPTAIVTWTSSNNDVHLAIANSPKQAHTFMSNTTFFVWKQTYFDAYDPYVVSYDVRDICPFSLNGRDYVVIINHQAAPNRFSVDSELFQLDIDKQHWISVQKIKTTGALDCEVFTLGNERYLAIANHVDKSHGPPKFDVNSIIYKFSGNKFIPFQCLNTFAATSIKAVKGFTDSFVLAVAQSDGVVMYQYNGWRFVKSPVQLPRGPLGRGVQTLTASNLGEDQVLIVGNPSANSEPNVFQFMFKEDTTFRDWHRSSLGWCENVKRQTSVEAVAGLEENFSGVFYVNQQSPINLFGNLTMKGNVDIQGTLSAPMVVDLETNHRLSHEIPITLQRLDDRLSELERNLTRTLNLMQRALRINGNQVVAAPYTFSDVNFVCRENDNCKVREITTRHLNNINVVNLQNDIIHLGSNQILDEQFHFEHIKIGGNLQVDGLVNGINTSQIVTTTGNHFLTAPQTLTNNLFVNDVNVRGHINNNVINATNLLTKTGDQNVLSHLVFNNRVSATTMSATTVNKIALSDLIKSVVTKDGNHIVRGHKTLHNVQVNGNLDLLKGATISGVDVLDLYKNMLWTHGHQTILAPMNFSSLSVSGNLKVDGNINGLKVPSDVMVLTNKSAVITAPKHFDGPVKIDHLEILKEINGVPRVMDASSEWVNALDIMLKTRRQTVTGKKTMSNIALGGHSAVEGLIDGVKLSEFARLAVKRSQTNLLPGSWVIQGNATFNNRLTVNGLVDGVNLTNLYRNSLKLVDSVIPNFSLFKFNREVRSETVNCKSINRANLETDFLTTSTDQIVLGRKTFSSIYANKDFIVAGKINNIDTRILNDSLLRSGNQLVVGPKVVHGDLYVNNLIVDRLNSVNMNYLILLNTSIPQVVTGPISFDSLAVTGGVNAQRLEIRDSLNRMNINDLLHKSLMYDAPQIITGSKQFNHLIIPRGADLQTDNVNGYNLRKVYDNAVLINVPQTITGNKVFKNRAAFDGLWFTGTFDGVHGSDIKNNWLLHGEPQTIKGDVIFEFGPTLRENLIIRSGLLNGQNIVALNASIVKKNEPSTIVGPVNIRGLVRSSGDVFVGGTVQGVKLSKEAVTRHGNAQVYGQKRFTRNLSVNGSMEVNGKLDDVFIDELCTNTVRRHTDASITAPTLVSGGIHVGKDLTTGGRINAIDVNEYNRSSVKLDEPAVVSGRKHFETLILIAPTELIGTLGGIDIRKLNMEYLSKTRNQVVRTPLSFAKGINFQSLLVVEGNFTTGDGLINGINLLNVDRNSLKLTGDQEISVPYTFTEDVIVENDLFINNASVNNVPLSSMAFKTRPTQIIHSYVSFSNNLIVERNVQTRPKRQVQGVDVAMLSSAALRPNGQYAVADSKHFHTVEVDHLNVAGLLNGIKFDKDNLMLTSGNNRLRGRFIFENGINFASNISTTTVNGVDLHQLVKRLVRNDASNSVTAAKTFQGKVFVNGSVSLNLINNVSVSNLRDLVKEKVDLGAIDTRLSFQDQKLERLQRVIDSPSTYQPDYHMMTSINSRLVQHHSTIADSLMFTVQPDHSCDRVEIRSTAVPDDIQSTVLAYRPSAIASIPIANQKLLIITSQVQTDNNSMACIDGGYAISRPTFGSGSSLIQILRFDNKMARYEPISLLRSQPTIDLKIISINTASACFVTASYKLNMTIFCIDSSGKLISTGYDVPNSRGSNKITILESKQAKKTFMAAIDRRSMMDFAFRVQIYEWSDSVKNFDTNPQVIFAYHPTAVHLFEMSSGGASTSYLFVAEGQVSALSNKPLVRIFKLTTAPRSQFMEIQQVPESQNVVDIGSVQTPDNDLLVFTLMHDSAVKVYKLRGASGFVNIDTINGKSASSMQLVSNDKSSRDRSYNLLLGYNDVEEDAPRIGFTKVLFAME